MYEGKTLSHWMAVRKTTETTDPSFPTPALASAIEAVRHMGTNALPFLIDDIRAMDSRIWGKLVMSAYKSGHKSIVRKMMRVSEKSGPGMWERHDRAVYFLRAMGPLAKPAIPALADCLDWPETAEPAVDVLGFGDSYRQAGLGLEATSALMKATTNGNFSVRRKAGNALSLWRANGDLVVPAMLSALHDPSAEVRSMAARSFGPYKAQASAIVPAVTRVVDDPDWTVRSGALWMLGMYGDKAASAIPKVVGRLSDVDVRVRKEATNAINLIEAKPGEAAGVN
jgi:hypothetical protein